MPQDVISSTRSLEQVPLYARVRTRRIRRTEHADKQGGEETPRAGYFGDSGGLCTIDSRATIFILFFSYLFLKKIRTHLDLLSIPQLGGKKCQKV